MPAPLEIIQEPGKAAAVFDPQRLRLLEHLKEPDSAAGIARRLQLSRQQVNLKPAVEEKQNFRSG
jgi:hypothetical protein